MIKSTKRAFTLVELIVVITILAILGTIAFISLQGYTKDSKDAKARTEISQLAGKIQIELAKASSDTQRKTNVFGPDAGGNGGPLTGSWIQEAFAKDYTVAWHTGSVQIINLDWTPWNGTAVYFVIYTGSQVEEGKYICQWYYSSTGTTIWTFDTANCRK